MANTVPRMGRTAPTTTTTTTTTSAEADAVRLHMLACNALAEALHTLRTADLSPEALARAIGRARRGATALRRMAELAGGAA